MVLFLCDHFFVTTLSHMQIFSYAIEEEMTLSRPFRILLAQIQRCRPLTARVTFFLPSLSIALPLNISFSLFFLFSSSSLTAALPVLPLPNFVHVSSCRSLDAASLRQSVNNTSVRGIAAWKWFPFYPSKQKKLHDAQRRWKWLTCLSDRSKRRSQLIDAASASDHAIWLLACTFCSKAMIPFRC